MVSYRNGPMPTSSEGEWSAVPPVVANYASPFSSSDVEALSPVVAEILRSGRLALGDHTDRFEQEFGRSTDAQYSVATSSGTTALWSTFCALGSEGNLQGGEVLVPAHTFFAVPAAVLLAGGTVRLVDVDTMSIAPSIEQLEECRSDSTVGVVLVHMGGIISPETPAIVEWSRRCGLWSVEDASHAHGSTLNGKHAGTFGDAGVLSMFATKVLTCGEGGVVITDNSELAERVRRFINLGRTDKWGGLHESIGTTGRMDELSAAIGRQLLRRADAIFRHRRVLAQVYDEMLEEMSIDGLSVIGPSHESAYYKYIVMLPPDVDRQELRGALRQDGVQLAGEIYAQPLSAQPAVQALLKTEHEFPVAEKYCAGHICLPIHGKMSKEDVVRVASSLRKHIGLTRR